MNSQRVLIVPDKFKGTLSAEAVAKSIARGWKQSRPKDRVEQLPMSDGGDGFGEIISRLLGARRQTIATVNAAHEPIEASWWWEPETKTAIIESAKVIGLALLPRGKFHPFQLDTFGLGAVLQAAAQKGARRCLIGIGGSATNDGGFGMARALGWQFLDRLDQPITRWTGLPALARMEPPRKKKLFPKLTVAVDVQNVLLGARGCSRVYGPQKGLQPGDFAAAESALRRLASVAAKTLKQDFLKTPGAGAAGGLGFGLMTFAGAEPESGFEIFARHSKLQNLIRQSDVVITGEGAIDRQTLMGKGVGAVATLAAEQGVPCLALAGHVEDPKKAAKLFKDVRGLTGLVSPEEAMRRPEPLLQQLAAQLARDLANRNA